MNGKVEIPQEVALLLTDTIEKLEIELEAHRQTLRLAKELSSQDADLLDESLILARQDPALLESMRQKYGAIREILHAEVIDALAQKEIDLLIERLRPTDRLN
jgi:hypothetical protein